MLPAYVVCGDGLDDVIAEGGDGVYLVVLLFKCYLACSTENLVISLPRPLKVDLAGLLKT